MFKRIAAVVIGGLVLSLAVILYVVSKENTKGELGRLVQNLSGNSYTIDVPTYSPPPPPAEELFVDDDLAQKHPTFDPALVDSRLEGGWKINTSDAVLRLDVPMTLPDSEADLLQLSPSYLKAIAAYRKKHGTGGAVILPSINMIDGKAKQFDDGLYAALDLAYYQGLDSVLVSHVDLLKRILARLDPKTEAAAFIAAALDLAQVRQDVGNASLKEFLVQIFLKDETRSKPAGFYTWNDKLGELFRVLRFLQQDLSREIALPLTQAIKADPAIEKDYTRLLAFFSRLTNPRDHLSLLELTPQTDPTEKVSFLPPATNKEARLFEKLFPAALPPDANLMRELVNAIRSGKVDLTPKPESGWYDYQVHALETMLLPEKGPESDKLLLTKSYKKRMLEAFQALMTLRRETHFRDAKTAAAAPTAAPLKALKPRLRLEPAPTYYLRTARSYAFLSNFLLSTLGDKPLASLHGLKADGQRAKDLKTELIEMRDLFYGCYLLSAEDIGMKPAFLKDEAVDQARCSRLAADWLAQIDKDADLDADTRVIVPVYIDRRQRLVRCWATLGIRLAKLDANYATPPSIQDAKKGGEWQKVEPYKLETSHYLIPVCDFAELELRGLRILNRDEFRAICDQHPNKEAIVQSFK